MSGESTDDSRGTVDRFNKILSFLVKPSLCHGMLKFFLGGQIYDNKSIYTILPT